MKQNGTAIEKYKQKMVNILCTENFKKIFNIYDSMQSQITAQHSTAQHSTDNYLTN